MSDPENSGTTAPKTPAPETITTQPDVVATDALVAAASPIGEARQVLEPGSDHHGIIARIEKLIQEAIEEIKSL